MTSSRLLRACQRATADTIPHTRGSASTRRGPVPGWNDAVRDARATAIWWHERWKECGRPREGWVAQIRRRTRALYHQAIKKCFSEENNIVRDKISTNLMQRDSKQFWNTISKLNKRNNNVCAMIDGRVGNDACNAFFDKYKNLYNKNPSPDIEQTRQSIQREISTKCCE